MNKLKKLTAIIVIIAMTVSLLTLTASANPSTYWCGTHNKTGCTHCASHTMQAVGTNTANCIIGGGQVRVCTAAGCGAAFYQNSPLGHTYNTSGDATKMCTRSTSCGNINGAGSNHFQHYMYRTTSLTNASNDRRANYISREHPTPGLSISGTSGTENGGIDITTNGWDPNGNGHINGYIVYAQATGTVTDRSSANNPHVDMGYWVEVTYTLNGTSTKVRYMHFASNPSVAKDSTVTTSHSLGATGTTGSSTGYHLHLDVKQGSSFKRTRDFFPSGTFR